MKLNLTQFDVPVQHEEDVAGLQVSVNDLHAVEVVQRLEHLATNHLDLRLCQPTIQLWQERKRLNKRVGVRDSNQTEQLQYDTLCTYLVWVLVSQSSLR